MTIWLENKSKKLPKINYWLIFSCDLSLNLIDDIEFITYHTLISTNQLILTWIIYKSKVNKILGNFHNISKLYKSYVIIKWDIKYAFWNILLALYIYKLFDAFKEDIYLIKKWL